MSDHDEHDPDPSDEAHEWPTEGPGSLAPIFPRAMARLTDFVVSVLVPQTILGLLFVETAVNEEGVQEITKVPLWLAPAFVVILAAYEIGLVAWRGQTLGMMVGRLEVVDMDTGAPPSRDAAIRRGILPVVAYGLGLYVAVAFIGYLAIYLSPLLEQTRRQGWHDKLARTVVVRTDRSILGNDREVDPAGELD